MTHRGETTQAEVLAVLCRRKCPISAYGILRELRGTSPTIAPPTVYRALSALRARGHVHRIESLNAFIASRGFRHPHASILSICGDCGTVEESDAPELLDKISSIAGRSGFASLRHVVEVHGTCASCGVDALPS